MPVLLPFPHLYLYRQCFGGEFRIGVMGLLNRAEARVLRHEHTLAGRTDLKLEGSLWLWCDTAFPVEGTPEVETLDASGCLHQIWTVTEPDRIRVLQEAFEGRELFLADGHHRYAAGWNVATIQTRSRSLRSRPSHRLVLDAGGMLLPATVPIEGIEPYLSSCPTGCWRAVVIRRRREPRGLEISRDVRLTELFRDAVVQPTREVGDAVAAVESGRAAMALLVAAYTVDQIEDYARRGVLLPPKSTDFYPKLLHGAQNDNVTPATAHLRGVLYPSS